MALTIGETSKQLHRALRDYIEATYHISEPTLVAQRRRLLDEPGVIHQQPYLESTTRYRPGKKYEDLGLDPAALEIFLSAASAAPGEKPLIHNPPYEHQAKALSHSLVEGESMVVTTGTGSGKTECFLLPILGKLAREAQAHPKSFGATQAVRAMVLYPMNALVNDQLGRLRLLFGDRRVAGKFTAWTGRPARFARYTSRTLYPGVRNEARDQDRLAPIGKYYATNLERANDPASPGYAASKTLVRELKVRGKWPAKPDLLAWYGRKGERWRDAKTGRFKRCVTLPEDPELFTRHEVHAAPPDILVTNYSMLEYMLMRPLERPIFDQTRKWLAENPGENFLLVVDEAHLYRGAAGAEVALLIRRLRMRLGIPPERLQVICTSASFSNQDYARQFGAQLTGKKSADFVTVAGDLLLREPATVGTAMDAAELAKIDLAAFYEATTDDLRRTQVASFLAYRGAKGIGDLARDLYEALHAYGPMGRLINTTMRQATPVSELGSLVFGGAPNRSTDTAVTNLIALGSIARRSADEPGLLPCRIHSFFRGLAGLWVCMDPNCSALEEEFRGGPAGKLYSQPRDECECGARVLPFYTCRHCGTAYARAYTNNPQNPDFLWSEPGGAFRTLTGAVAEFEPLDLLLEPEVFSDKVEPAEYDLESGRINPQVLGSRNRRVCMRADRTEPIDANDPKNRRSPGEFRPCAVCGEHAAFGRTSVQDHQTKGDQPFQALIARQIQIQPPNAVPATKLAPLRGRKVLIFSDSRQTAARLAPNLQTYSTRDVLRPLIVVGFSQLLGSPVVRPFVSLEDIYLAALIGANRLGVRLRPELKVGESFQHGSTVDDAIADGAMKPENSTALLGLVLQARSHRPPEALLRDLVNAVSDRYYGLSSLALASVIERPEHTAKFAALPDLTAVAETADAKTAIARAWLRCWMRAGFWLAHMPLPWWPDEVGPHSGNFNEMKHLIPNKAAKTTFDREWLPVLLRTFATVMAEKKYRLEGRELSLEIGGAWAYCRNCRTTQRPTAGTNICINCGQPSALPVDPNADPVFTARKGYYRTSTVDALREPPVAPMALIAAEHTAQLNTAQAQDVFSRAEEHELLFQDVDLGPDDKDRERPAIDVLSCTTTMEVGIDIGTLSGVSLRNMPPSRASYQQRAGRAGRRGTAVATVTAFGSADSHDEYYFTHPDLMIRGDVDDPKLTLNNPEIARRHVTAYLLQRYHQDRLPHIAPEEQPHLFAVLGRVADFKSPGKLLTRVNFEEWLRKYERALQGEVDQWLPAELTESDRRELLGGIVAETLRQLDDAIEYVPGENEPEADPGDGEDQVVPEAPPELGDEQGGANLNTTNLLDRLLYKGVLPRYAFPTDVATFHVFDVERSSRFRPVFQFTPSQGLPAALSQYAPGKEVWIGNKLWTSGAIYSPVGKERYRAWQAKRIYLECSRCHYARTEDFQPGLRGETRDCEACGGHATFGPARQWLRPPGFAHPVGKAEGTSPDEPPARSYASRAKLTMPTPTDQAKWTRLNERLRIHGTRQHLLVTNRGPLNEGYTYCTRCGLIEPTALPNGIVAAAHKKPYPDPKDQNCAGGAATKGLVLGTDFISDVLLISLTVPPPFSLIPGVLSTESVLRTLSEAITKAACKRLQIEASELQSEFRPALTEAGREGREAEIYLYDTLPGGAGFAQRAGDYGLLVFEDALKLLEDCPEQCDRSCYRCLRSYKNKFEHDLLDRHLGATLLRYLLTGELPVSDPDRFKKSADLLFEDLQRQRVDGITFERNRTLAANGVGSLTAPVYAEKIDGTRFVIGLHSPLTPGFSSDECLHRLQECSTEYRVVLVDELVVRRNLPNATALVLDQIR